MTVGMMKICSECKQDKPSSEFTKKSASKDGLHTNCKPCVRAYASEYFRKTYVAHPRVEMDTKVCPCCGEDKPKADFYLSRGKSKGKGRQAYCRACTKLRQRTRFYGLSNEQFNAMLDAQSGCCGICGNVLTPGMVVDHDHDTGFVRGILCRRCNRDVAAVERPGFVIAARKYLCRALANTMGSATRGDRRKGARVAAAVKPALRLEHTP